MIKTEYISRYTNLKKISEVYNYCSSLALYYPGFQKWFNTKVLDGIFDGNRIIVIKRVNQELAGFTILKNDFERKICTLKVCDNYKGRGIGNELMYNSLELLGTDKPIITVSERKLQELLPLLHNYDFKLNKKLVSLYKNNEVEYCFNTGFENVSEQEGCTAFNKAILC